MGATTIANEISFDRRRAGYEPLEVGDGFQAIGRLLLDIDFNIGFRDIETWTGFVCDAPHVMGQEVTRSGRIAT